MSKLLYSFDYLYLDDLLATVSVYNDKVTFVNYTDNILDRPFGRKEKVNLKDLEDLYAYRCFPYTRFNRKQLVEDLPGGYDRFEIVKRTKGIMSDDCFWIRFDWDKNLHWKDVKYLHDH